MGPGAKNVSRGLVVLLLLIALGFSAYLLTRGGEQTLPTPPAFSAETASPGIGSILADAAKRQDTGELKEIRERLLSSPDSVVWSGNPPTLRFSMEKLSNTIYIFFRMIAKRGKSGPGHV